MDIKTEGNALTVSGIAELTAANSAEIKAAIKEALQSSHNRIDVDFSTTTFIDSSGLGVLIGLHKAMVSQSGSIRILNPTDSVQQVLELTRLHRLFEVVRQ